MNKYQIIFNERWPLSANAMDCFEFHIEGGFVWTYDENGDPVNVIKADFVDFICRIKGKEGK